MHFFDVTCEKKERLDLMNKKQIIKNYVRFSTVTILFFLFLQFVASKFSFFCFFFRSFRLSRDGHKSLTI